jgi:FkbM family methyltransferase
MALFPNAKLFAFEASKLNYELCLSRYESLPQEYKNKLNIYNFALNDINGFIKFYQVLGNNPGASSKYKFMDGLNGKYFNQVWQQDEGIEVECQTLDYWKSNNLNEDIDIIWMDVQGSELDVLKGCKQSLNNIKCIFTEVGIKPYYDGQSLKDDIDKFLCLENNFVEIKDSFEFNGSDCEANTIYVNKRFLKD